MNTQDFNENTPMSGRTPEREHSEGKADSTRHRLSRSMRLVSRLMRAEMRKTFEADPEPTRGEVKAAAQAVEDRIADAVSPEELEITLATLDKIAEAFGGRDALPFRAPRGHGGHGGHGHRWHGGRGFDKRGFDGPDYGYGPERARAASRFGGREFGGREFGGREFGGREFGQERFERSDRRHGGPFAR